jgi:hypothetical protein
MKGRGLGRQSMSEAGPHVPHEGLGGREKDGEMPTVTDLVPPTSANNTSKNTPRTPVPAAMGPLYF